MSNKVLITGIVILGLYYFYNKGKSLPIIGDVL